MWLKVDDGFPQHPKVVAAAARLGSNGLGRVLAVWVEAMCSCNRHLTDGLVSNAVVSALKSDKNAVEVFRILAQKSVKLAHRTRDGWQMHDYHEYQPSKAEVEKKRKKERNRKRRVRGKSARTAASVRDVSERTRSPRPRAVRAVSADPDPIRSGPSPVDQKPDQKQRAETARDSLANGWHGERKTDEASLANAQKIANLMFDEVDAGTLAEHDATVNELKFRLSEAGLRWDDLNELPHKAWTMVVEHRRKRKAG